MLVKFFDRGKGTGDAPVNYLLGDKFIASGLQKNELRAGARIVSGNPLITQEMINASNFAKRYTAGVLSFEEAPDEVNEADKKAIIQDFEKMLFPGMNPDRTNFLWVEHTDKLHPETGKPRLELNFVIPTTELYTAKRLQPYFHAQDKKYSNAWQTLTNDRYGLSDPDDIQHRRVINPFDSNQSPKKTHKNVKEQIDEYLRIQMLNGKIKNRNDVIREIELMPNGMKVTRISPKFISVTSGASNKPIRLKGFVFEQNFDFEHYRVRMQPDSLLSNQEVAQEDILVSQVAKQQRVDQALVNFNAIYHHKAKYNQKKYAIPDEEMAWVNEYYAPQFLDKSAIQEINLGVSQATIFVNHQVQNDAVTNLDKTNIDSQHNTQAVQIVSKLMHEQNTIAVSDDSLNNEIDNALHLANVNRATVATKKAEAEKNRLRLEQQRLDYEKHLKIQKERSKKQQEEQNRLMVMAPQIGIVDN